jgi:nitrite reductase (NADH) small subunit
MSLDDVAAAIIAANDAAGRAPWRRLCRLEEIPRAGARVVNAAGNSIAVFRTEADEVFALNDRCPHKGGPLSQGIVFGRRVACPLHNWAIELDSGQAVAPDQGCAGRYPAKVEAGVVWLKLAES